VLEGRLKPLGNVFVGFAKVLHDTELYLLRGGGDVTCDVTNEALLGVLGPESVKVSGLLVVFAGALVRETTRVAAEVGGLGHRRRGQGCVLWLVHGVGFVVGKRAKVRKGHKSVALMIMDFGAVRCVDGKLRVIHSQAMTVSVGVREQAALEHSIF